MKFISNKDGLEELASYSQLDFKSKFKYCGMNDEKVLLFEMKAAPEVKVKVFPNRENGYAVVADFGFGEISSNNYKCLETIGHKLAKAFDMDTPWEPFA